LAILKDTLPDRVRFGAFELDPKAGELYLVPATGDRLESRIVLPQQPFRLLLMLVEREGAMVTREEIQKTFWPNDTIVEFDHSINVAIGKLRKALGDSADAPQYIATVASRGYRLMMPVEQISVTEDSPGEAVAQVAGGAGAAARLQPIAAVLIGQTVSHYRVLDIIGGGGMGVVYRAEDLKLGRRVAMKFLPEEMANDERTLQRFEREAQTASSLNHPNICTIYEFGEHEGQPFLVMESLQGETLRDRLHAAGGAGLPLEDLLDIALQVTDGLQAAHEQGIIHRDIKPANIFLTSKGVCKILDFGLAKLATAVSEIEREAEDKRLQNSVGLEQKQTTPAGGDATLTRTGSAMGTAGYMSPEQVRGEKLDARSDLFSFGLVLYEMASGLRAFNGETAEIVHDAIVKQPQIPIRELNSTLPRELERITNKALEKDRERRYQSAAEMGADLEEVRSGKRARARQLWIWAVAAALLAVLAMAGGLYWRSRNRPKLTYKDTIVLADFDNKTGDAVFDDALKQALTIQLEQSPFLDLVSGSKVNETLKLMEHSADDRLTPAVARELCLRTESKAMVVGSIAELGSQYVIGLKAVNCNTGDVQAESQESAVGKEAVLKALDAAAVTLRRKLGEPHPSIERYATPLEAATTSSLEALKAYSLGRKTKFAKGDTAALPFYKRAVELDPNFAMAYLAMSVVYHNMNEVTRSADNARRAFELREKVSERERFQIEARYYTNATGELEKAAETFKSWQQTYPKDDAPYRGSAFVFTSLGDHEQALQERREALRLEPNNGINYGALGVEYVALNQLDEAEAVYKQAEDLKLESEDLPFDRYVLAFLKGDTARMAQVAAGAVGKPGTEDLVLASLADTEGWYGRLRNARELTQRAMDSAERNDAKETAAIYQAAAALREVEAGSFEQARADANAALKLGPTRDVQALAALALARAGDMATAEKLAAELDKQLPLDTMAQRYWLPSIQAAVALQRKDPNRAVELLKTSSAIELSVPAEGALWPVYLRGEAYLMLHDGKAAAAEFQKFVDHYGVAGNFPWGSLARLGLARAYALDAAKDPAAREKARTAYQNFLTIWKDADPDIPIYKAAKAEYAKLQ
jgi:serine/threonine protein kinase